MSKRGHLPTIPGVDTPTPWDVPWRDLEYLAYLESNAEQRDTLQDEERTIKTVDNPEITKMANLLQEGAARMIRMTVEDESSFRHEQLTQNPILDGTTVHIKGSVN